MFEAEKSGEQEATLEQALLLCEDNREEKQAVEEAIVLEVDVIDDQQSG